MGAEDKAKVESSSNKLKQAIESEDFDTMKSELETLQQALYAAGAAVYQNAAAADGAAAGGNGNSAGATNAADDVIDAEFSESK